MFSNLRSARGVDDSDLRRDDDVRDSRIGSGVTEPLLNQAITPNDVRDFKRLAVIFQ